MLKFKNRIKFYLIGFGLGLVAMFFFFGNRACSWLPENRVKNMLAEKQIIVGDSVAYLMACQEVTNEDIYRLLDDDGDVDFSKSTTNIEPKEYHLYGEKGSEDLVIRYALGEVFTEVIGFDFPQKNCETSLSNENKSTVPIPNFVMISIIEENEMRILEKAECQIKCLNLDEEKVRTFHKTAVVIMDESDSKVKPNPYYVMEGTINGKLLRVKYIIGENRTRIEEITSIDSTCNC